MPTCNVSGQRQLGNILAEMRVVTQILSSDALFKMSEGGGRVGDFEVRGVEPTQRSRIQVAEGQSRFSGSL